MSKFKNIKGLWIKALLGISIFMTASGSFGISKVGGQSIVSPDNGFAVLRPPKFFQVEQLNDDRVRFVGSFVIMNNQFQPQLMYLDSFGQLYPQLQNDSRTDTVNYFLQNGWTQATAADPCAVAFVKSSSTGLGYVSTWGQGRGVYITVVNTVDGREALDAMVQSLTIDSTLCGW